MSHIIRPSGQKYDMAHIILPPREPLQPITVKVLHSYGHNKMQMETILKDKMGAGSDTSHSECQYLH